MGLLIVPLWTVLISPLLIVFIIYCLSISKYYRYWEKRNIPTEGNFILVNNFYKVIGGRQHYGDFLKQIYEKYPDEPFVGFYIFGKPYLIIRNPEIIKNITVRDFYYFEHRSLACDEEVDEFAAKSVFFSRNPQWKFTRTKLNTLFSPAKLKLMAQDMLDSSRELQNYLEQYDNEIVDFKDLGENFISKLMTKIFFGIDSNCGLNEKNNAVRNAISNMLEKSASQVFAFFSYMFVPKFVSWFKIKIANLEYLKMMALDSINYRENNETKGKVTADLLVSSIKEESGEKNRKLFDKNWVIAQAITLTFAGFAPNVSLIALTLYELSLNQDCQDELRKEIFETFPDENEPITYEKVIKMNYLNMIVSETTRYGGGFINRVCTQDYIVEETGLKIEKGISCMISADGIHFDPKYYQDPEKYNPERFRDGTKDLENNCMYIPFGSGIRRCVGDKFYQALIKIVLVHILRKFRVETCHLTIPFTFDPTGITLSILNEMNLRIHKL